MAEFDWKSKGDPLPEIDPEPEKPKCPVCGALPDQVDSLVTRRRVAYWCNGCNHHWSEFRTYSTKEE